MYPLGLNWVLEPAPVGNLFTPDTESKPIRKFYSLCRDPPALHLLDKFRATGPPCLKFFSYPQEEWKRIILKDLNEKQNRRRQRERAQSIGPALLDAEASPMTMVMGMSAPCGKQVAYSQHI